jgi:nitroreductase
MTRSFTDAPVAPEVVDRLLDAARRAPSAGYTQAVEFVVLEGTDQTGAYWDVTLPTARRASFPWPGLLAAPVLVIPVVQSDAYVARYREPDKATTGLGESSTDWAVPYWYVDGGASVMLLLLATTAEGLGSLFFGQFEHEAAVAERFGIPADRRALGTIAIGHPADDDRPSHSVRSRPRRPLDGLTHRGHW